MKNILGLVVWAILASGCSQLDREVSYTSVLIARAVSVGNSHSCGLNSGQVKCWGANTAGQLGDGTTTESSTPIKPYVLPARAYGLTTGGAHTCALLAVSSGANSSLRCWGDNAQGQLGNGSLLASLYPVDINLGISPVAIMAGIEYTCAQGGAGAGIRCWGRNDLGQVGNGGGAQVTTPATVLTGTSVLSLGVGTSHSCAVLNSGIKCWGLNTSNQLGVDLPPPVVPANRTTPVDVLGHLVGSGAVQVETGSDHSCAVIQNVLKCWGNNSVGQLGDGTTTNRAIPTPVTGLPAGLTVSLLVLGTQTTFAMMSNNALYAWGLNTTGQLGNNSTVNSSTPTLVSTPPAGVLSISASINGHTCVATATEFYCWGQNTNGQLGNGSTTQSLVPTKVNF